MKVVTAVKTEAELVKILVREAIFGAANERCALVVNLIAVQSGFLCCADNLRVDAFVEVYTIHIMCVRALVVGHQHSFHVVFLGERAVEVDACLVQLAVKEKVVLPLCGFGRGVNGLGVNVVALFFGVVGVERHGVVDGGFDALVIVKHASDVSRESFKP